MTRLMLEMGMGADLHGASYTKAAVRAVDDALRHSSINFRAALGLEPGQLRISVRIGVADPAAVEVAAVLERVPHEGVTIDVVAGGLDLPGARADDPAVIASAAVEVWLDR